jgi:hypothetical protein
MVELQPIFKKAYWTLAAGGLVYVSFICSLTWPNVQRLYALLIHIPTNATNDCGAIHIVRCMRTKSILLCGRMSTRSSALGS